MSQPFDLSKISKREPDRQVIVSETHYTSFGWSFRKLDSPQGELTQLVLADLGGHAHTFTFTVIDRANFRRDLERVCSADDNGHV